MSEQPAKFKGIVLTNQSVLITQCDTTPEIVDQVIELNLNAGSPILIPGSLMEFSTTDQLTNWKSGPVRVQSSGLISAKNPAIKVPIEAGPELKAQLKQPAVLIDVRTSGEFTRGHLSGSINIPVQHIHKEIKEQVADKAEPVIVYCATGHRSGLAAKLLKLFGYKIVIDLGGLNKFTGPLEK